MEEYVILLKRHARRIIYNYADVEDLVMECLHAYRLRFGVYPWEATPDASHNPVHWCLCKLRALICDYSKRVSTRHEVNLLDADNAESPLAFALEQHAVNRLMLEQFLEHLPPYLRRVAIMYEEGYTYLEIAEALGVALGTVQGYIARIVKLGRTFYEVDGNKSVVQFVNMGGSRKTRFSESVKEVCDDTNETTALADDERNIAANCQYHSDALHACRTRRNKRGGAADKFVDVGCAVANPPKSAEAVRQMLAKNRLSVQNVMPARKQGPKQGGQKQECFDQTRCDWTPVGKVWQCVDVFWPCDLFGSWHRRYKCDNSVLLCPTSSGGFCYRDIRCENCTSGDCCDTEYNDCIPSNTRCSELNPCPRALPSQNTRQD